MNKMIVMVLMLSLIGNGGSKIDRQSAAYSNLADEASRTEVAAVLESSGLYRQQIETVFAWVEDFNEISRSYEFKEGFQPLPKDGMDYSTLSLDDTAENYAYLQETQVTVEYDENGKPSRIDAVVCSTQHDPDVTQEQIHADIKKYVFDEIIPADMVDEDTKYFINPTGRFVIGGPNGDSGLTGRKIIVDTYGGTGRHGGGAFSGKDCTKVDRSAAYAARYVAKNIVAAGLADKCEIQLSYAIGVAHPTSIHVETFGTGKVSDAKLVEIIRENFDLRPAGIIKMLDLRRPIYKQTSAYGHFGRTDVDLPWEHLDKVDDLKKYLA